MPGPTEGPIADVEAAYDRLDDAHDLLARAARRWDPQGSCPCGPPEVQDALEEVGNACRSLQAVLRPVPGE